MKIAYLHGLESSIDQKDPKIIFLNNNFDKAYMPSINYRDDSTFDKLYKDIKSLNPDLIVGSSMGGYVSYLIGSKLSIPVLLFNPAMVGRTFDPVVDDSNLKKTRIDIRFGKSDSVISGKDVRKYLKDNKVSFDHTGYTGGHRVPADVFINSIKEVLDMSEIYNKIEKSQYKMKHVRLFEEFSEEIAHEYDFVGMQASKLGMTREEYTAHYLTPTIGSGIDEAKAVSSQNEPFRVKGINFTYTEQRGRFYGAYLYDVAKTANVQHKAKFGLDEINAFLKSIKITDKVPSTYEIDELDALCKQIAKKGIVCDHNDAMDIS